jgi:DNA-binding CsgD family transcriptional regulator
MMRAEGKSGIVRAIVSKPVCQCMPLIAFADLCPDGPLKEAGDRLMDLVPGMVLTTGQSVSGKVTVLLALVARMATEGRAVILLTDQPGHYAPFHPLPTAWNAVEVQPTRGAWEHAIQAASRTDALLVVTPLNRENAASAMAVAQGRWVFAALDTALSGLDASYVSRDMGVEYGAFAENVRCVWSQFLVEALCEECAKETEESPEEADQWIASSNRHPGRIKREVGCARCEGRDTRGRVAISDVTFITDDVRAMVRGALVQGLSVAMSPDLHIAAQEQARELLRKGVIGINTYRDAIRRNPLLRTQNALERVKIQSLKLTSMFDTFVMSLWVDLDVLSAVADRTAAGVVVVDDTRAVRFASARARRLLCNDGELSIVDDCLYAGAPRIRCSLEEAIEKAVRIEPVATRLTLRIGAAGKSEVFVTPLPPVRGFARGMRRLALIVLGGREHPNSMPSGQDLQQFFDLTPAESRVALMLCAGYAPKQVARELHVSVPTVRTHLRALLQKTGTARQAQLVQLLASMPRCGPDEETGKRATSA